MLRLCGPSPRLELFVPFAASLQVLGGAIIALSFFIASRLSQTWIVSIPLYVALAVACYVFSIRVRNDAGLVECLLVKEGLESAGMCAGLAVVLLLLGSPSSLAAVPRARLPVRWPHVGMGLLGMGAVTRVPKLLKFMDSNGRAPAWQAAGVSAVVALLQLWVMYVVPFALPQWVQL